MKIRVQNGVDGDEMELTVISFVNGVVICIDESLTEEEELDNYERIENLKKSEESKPSERKRLRKDPEDNLSDPISTMDTAEIERGVDFENIIKSIYKLVTEKKLTIEQFFTDIDILADYCEYYNYTLLNFIRLFMEHMPELMTVDFIKKVIKPTVSNAMKRKAEFEKSGNGEQYRKIFAHL